MNTVKITSTFIVLITALIASAVTVLLVGESPLNVVNILATSAFGSGDGLTTTLFYATPLFLTGAAVLVPYRAGLFNIGAEGQLYMGAVGAITWGLYWGGFAASHNPSILFMAFVWCGALICSFVCGGLYGLIAAWLKAVRGVHEVIATIMMNFIALAFANWVILYPLKNIETQSVESRWIAEAFRLPKFWQNLPASFPLALIASAAALLVLRYTWWGYRVRASGENPSAARVAGIPVRQSMLSAMFVGGGLAGLVGFHEVFCNSYRLIDGFSPQFGFTGIAIALLCRGNLPAFFASALFFAALHKGTLDLDLETENITRDLASVIQAWLLIALAMSPALERFIAERLARRQRQT